VRNYRDPPLGSLELKSLDKSPAPSQMELRTPGINGKMQLHVNKSNGSLGENSA